MAASVVVKKGDYEGITGTVRGTTPACLRRRQKNKPEDKVTVLIHGVSSEIVVPLGDLEIKS